MPTTASPKQAFIGRNAAGDPGWTRGDTVRRLGRSIGTRSQQPQKVRAFYELLSTTNFFTEESLYFNLGYWAAAPATFDAACEALADQLAYAAEIKDGDTVLDAGCGFGDAALRWANEHPARSVVGINITPLQGRIARERGRSSSGAGVEILSADATELPFRDGSIDVVLALESAFHFVTREDFFGDAFRVLRPGGRLATADMLPLPRRRRGVLPQAVRDCLLDLAITVYPHQNVYDRYEYATKLRSCGFDEVQVRSIRDDVYPGAVAHLAQRIDAGDPSLPLTAFERRLTQLAVLRGPVGRRLRYGYDYVIAVARRPTDRGSA